MNQNTVYDIRRVTAIKNLPIFFGTAISCFVTSLLTLYMCWSISDAWFTRTVFVTGGASIQLAIFLSWPEIRKRWHDSDIVGTLRISAFLACLEMISIVASISGMNSGLAMGQIEHDNVISARSSIEYQISVIRSAIDANSVSITKLQSVDRISRQGGANDLVNQNLILQTKIAELNSQLNSIPAASVSSASVLENSFGSVSLVVILLSFAFDAVCAFFLARLHDCFDASDDNKAKSITDSSEEPIYNYESEIIPCSAAITSPNIFISKTTDKLFETIKKDIKKRSVKTTKGAVRKKYGIGTDRVNAIFKDLVDISVLCKTEKNRYKLID